MPCPCEKKPVVRVGVPYPNGGGLHPKCRESLSALSKFASLKCEIAEVEGALIAVNRNHAIVSESNLVYQTKLPFDYYLSVDADIEFKPEDVASLMKHDVGIVSGAYKARNLDGKTCAGVFQEVVGVIDVKSGFLPWELTGLREIDWCGAGFLLIKKDVLLKMKFPYFRETVIEYQDDGQWKMQYAGEDIGFCIAAAAAGFKIYVDMDVKAVHHTEPYAPHSAKRTYTPEEAYKLFMETLGTLKKCGDMFYRGLQTPKPDGKG